MKKITQLFAVAACMMATGANAQDFFLKTDYVGALSSDASKDWTLGWTEWNPKQASYPAVDETTTLNGSSTGKLEITSTVTLDATKVYLLKGLVVVKSGAKLVIPAGTIIRGEADLTVTPKNYASIVVERGGMIEINGTSSKPVVITSNKAAGSRERGDWGGIIVCGKAQNNQGSDVQVEGFSGVSFDATLAKHGGTSNDDNSGSISYCRLEFGGLAFEPNKEINGLTFGSVGNKTMVDGVQVSFGGDDAFEWFGGSVNCKHLIAYKTTDDDFDTDFGYSGAVQFGIGVKDTAYYDLTYNLPSGSSTSEGFESDNDAGGSGKTPYTSAVFSNMTMIGPVAIGQTYSDLASIQKAAFRRGARIRRNSRQSIVNSIFMGYRNFVYFDGDSTLKAAGVMDSTFPGSMAFQGNLIVNSAAAVAPSSTANGLVEVANASYLTKFDGWVKSGANKNNINPVAYTSKTVLEDPQHNTSPNFRPVSASPALSGADWNHAKVKSYGVWNSVNYMTEIGTYNIYPNPAQNMLYADLEMTAPTAVTVSIYSLSGKLIQGGLQQNLSAGFNSVPVSTDALNNGIYLLVIQSAHGSLTSRITVSK